MMIKHLLKKFYEFEPKRDNWQNTFSFHSLNEYKKTEKPSKENSSGESRGKGREMKDKVKILTFSAKFQRDFALS